MKLQKKHGYLNKVFFILATSFLFFFFALSIPASVIALEQTSVSNTAVDNGICGYIKNEIRPGSKNNDPIEIAKLQYFLKQYEGFSTLSVDGILNSQTISAVKAFQVKYSAEVLKPWGYEKPTGVVYFLTQKKINEIVCGIKISLTASQQQEIQNFKTYKATSASITIAPQPAVQVTETKVEPVQVAEPVSVTPQDIKNEVAENVEEVLGDDKVVVNKRIFGSWFSSFGADANDTKYSIFSLPRGINAVEAVVLFLVVLLILNVLSTMIGKRRSAFFLVGALVAMAGSTVFNKAYLVIPFLIVGAISLYVFLKSTFKKDAEVFAESEPVSVFDDVQQSIPMEEPEPIVEPAADIEIDPVIVQAVPEISTQQEVKIIMGHVVQANPPANLPTNITDQKN